jgi:pyruvate/2-oxoglutarate dehydrogenase complex dihydrolipoamide acyltransferase (E2) component
VSSSPTSSGLMDITMPQMGVSIAEATVIEWKKQPGDAVEADEPIVEISTDKAESDVPAPAAGRLKEVLVEAGETVDVGTVIARIETGAAAPPAPAGDDGQAAARGDGEASAGGDGQASADGGNGGEPTVTPVVRRMAEKHNLDLSRIEGSGRRGRVTKKDVVAYLRERDESAAAQEERAEPAAAPAELAEPVLHMESPYREDAPPAAAPAPAPAEAAAPGGRELSVMRKRIAEHMVRSLQTAAHCTTIVEADMSRIETARGRRSYLPFVARATIIALREHPNLNATLDGDMLTVHDDVHLGIAVSLGEDGLVVPVIRDAHELSHEGLGARIKDVAERARSKRLSPDELRGGTFTITNPGAYGAVLATPIINQPQVAILDLEAVVKRPVVVTDADGHDSIAIRPMSYLCMSWDHRALDGALAAQFLSTLKRVVESWQG